MWHNVKEDIVHISYEFLNELNHQARHTSVIFKKIIITEEPINECAGLLLPGKKNSFKSMTWIEE